MYVCMYVYVVIKIGIARKSLKYVETWYFKHFKANSFKIDLKNARWPVIDTINCVNEAWSKWKSVFLNILNKQVPKRKTVTGLQIDWLSFKKARKKE